MLTKLLKLLFLVLLYIGRSIRACPASYQPGAPFGPPEAASAWTISSGLPGGAWALEDTDGSSDTEGGT